MLGGLDISIQAPEVSFTVWVKTSRVFSKGYIFRKRLDAAGFGSDLSCWALFLNRDRGPELRYGTCCVQILLVFVEMPRLFVELPCLGPRLQEHCRTGTCLTTVGQLVSLQEKYEGL